MGLAIRNADKLGIHRDGSLLGLSPVETEDRRRLWWQLQHLDLALGVRCGLTPLTLMANWDAKLPSNIEDDDIDATMTSSPKEREGLTSLSYCLFTYWVIDHQRQFFRTDNKTSFELSWQTSESIPQPSKESLIDQLEDKVNQKFLQYCDPLRPIDTLLQLLARMLICGMRQRTLHALSCSGTVSEAEELQRLSAQKLQALRDAEATRHELELREAKKRKILLDASMRLLEYNVAMHSQRSLRHFRWLTKGFFPWQACKRGVS